MRIRITFAKTDAMRYTSHLDLHKAWERTFRRARLPLAYSQGFNPHPRLNLASALPLGFTGDCEVIDAWLEENLPLDAVQTALEGSAPPGIRISRIAEVDPRTPALQTELEASEFLITFLEPIPDLETRCAALLTAASLPRERRGKPYDLRSLIQELVLLPPDDQGRPRLRARLTAHEGATGRPEEVVAALEFDPLATRVHRSALIFKPS